MNKGDPTAKWQSLTWDMDGAFNDTKAFLATRHEVFWAYLERKLKEADQSQPAAPPDEARPSIPTGMKRCLRHSLSEVSLGLSPSQPFGKKQRQSVPCWVRIFFQKHLSAPCWVRIFSKPTKVPPVECV